MADSSRPDEIGVDPVRRLTRLFADQLARNTPHFGGGGPGYYGVRLEDVAPDGSELDLILTLRSGERYCCLELGCHFGIGGTRYWSGIREEMDASGLGDLPVPTIRVIRVVVEAGALIDLGGVPRRHKPMEYEGGPFCPEQDDPHC
jgi:hypothetical protein